MTIKPVRVQRSRHKKLRSPNKLPVVYCGRPSIWGNPYKIWQEWHKYGHKNKQWYVLSNGFISAGPYSSEEKAVKRAIELFKKNRLPLLKEAFNLKKELGGKNLACWCSLDQPCHCDILLVEANKE